MRDLDDSLAPRGRAYEEATAFTRKGEALNLLKLRNGDVAKGKPITRSSAASTSTCAPTLAVGACLTSVGLSQTVAMQLAGHRTPSLFRRYDVTSESDLTDAAAKLDAAANRDNS